MSKKIVKVVVTGGPCAGKTTAMNWISNTFTQKGYVVLFVPETATELISGGVAPWTCGTNEDYQKGQVHLQIQKEKVFMDAALTMKQEKILIVCDRGILDNKAYMNDEEYAHVLEHVHLEEKDALASYGAVFHLVTAAKGAEAFYTTANNAARYETVEEAVQLDERLLNSWRHHPNLYVIDNETGFTEKMKKLLRVMSIYLGEETPYEQRRKFLVKACDVDILRQYPRFEHEQILQTYLYSDESEEVRIREIRKNGTSSFMQSIKQFHDNGDTVVLERRLNEKEYYGLLAYEDPSIYALYRDRYAFTYKDNFYEVDQFAFMPDQLILRVYTDERLKIPDIPPCFDIIKEVTEDPHYKNKALSMMVGKLNHEK